MAFTVPPAPAAGETAPNPWTLASGVTTIAGQTIDIPGDMVVPSGAWLSISDSVLRFTGPPGQHLTVEGGGALIATSTAFLAAGGSGHWFAFDARPDSRVGMSGCQVRGVGADEPEVAMRGMRLAGRSVALIDCTIADAPAGLILDGAPANTQVESVRFESTRTDVVLLNGSNVTFLDTAPSALEIGAGSSLCLDFTLKARFVTPFDLTVPLVDFRARQGNASLYATPGFGGGSPVVREDLFGEGLFPTIRAQGRCIGEGNATVLHTVELSAKFAEWSENRTVALVAPTTETFHPAPAFTSFANVTDAAGVRGNDRFDGDTFGPGAAWGDYDGDGYPDLYVADSATLGVWVPLHKGPNHLYHNNRGDGSFTEVTNETGTAFNGSWGVSWADFDNDGDLDLYLTNYGDGSTFYSQGAPNVLFKSLLKETGVARFVDITAAAGVAGDGHSTSSAWGDYDNDGWLDLYVCNLGIMNHMTWWLRNESNILYHNNRDGTFTDVTFKAGGVTGGNLAPGMGDPQQFVYLPAGYNGTGLDYSLEWAGDLNRGSGPSGMSFAAAWFDADQDGDLDLLVGNDHGLNAFYRNSGDGTFRDDTIQAGFGILGSGMGLAVGDYDNDGDLDVYQTNFNPDYLWRNRGDGTFEEVSARSGLENVLVGWGTSFQDFNNDGWLDLFVANGRVFMNASMIGSRPKNASEPDRLYRNNRDGTFTEVTGTAGLENNLNSMGAAFADFDRDGAVDIYVGNTDGPELLLHNNAMAQEPQSWLEVGLVGTLSNRDGVGANVQVSAGGRTYLREMVGGGSFLGSGPTPLHFGLGGAALADSVDVYWPSGLHTQLRNVTLNQVIAAKEEAPFLADAGPDFTVDEDTPVDLDASGSGYLDPATAFRRAMTWTYEDRGRLVTLLGERPRAVFADPGVYNVTLTADDLAGEVKTDTVKATVLDRTPPNVTLPLELAVDEGQEVDLNLSLATDNDLAFPQGASFAFEVVGAQGSSAFDGSVLRYTPTAPGMYLVKGVVTDGAGNRGHATLKLRVRDLTPPTLEVPAERTVRPGELLVIEPTALSDNDPAFNATGSLTWSFAVGHDCRVHVTVYGRQLVYMFETPGIYPVTVNATDGAGHSTVRTVTVVVKAAPGGGGTAMAPAAATAGGLGAVAAATFVFLRRRSRRGSSP